jgi:anhydro-N-acetylmuramic acid kinase
MKNLYIGLMSGTSLDGVDGVLVDFTPQACAGLHVLAHTHCSFSPALATELLALNTAGDNELHRAALCGNQMARVYADTVHALLKDNTAWRNQVMAVAAHGQTVRHQPQRFDATGYTLQLINPALLAELCGLDVVADLRSRDVAAGGQGAPLVSPFHRAVFAPKNHTVGVLNVGGISNLTALHADGRTLGWDCGPGNALMDHWCQHHTGQPFDDAGAWGASGRVIPDLLQRLLAEPYLAQTPPKSTGRDLFNPAWLAAHVSAQDVARPADVQATLTEFTAAVCAADVRSHVQNARELLVCGGGAYNLHLMQRLGAHLPGVAVLTTATRGLPPNQVEACAFAWMARAFMQRDCANLPSVTGASGPRPLGAWYPASWA